MRRWKKGLAGVLILGMVAGVPVYADSVKTVTLGADLTESQKNLVLSYFDIDDENKNDFQFITINNQEEREALGDIISLDQIGTKTYSCAYMEPTKDGGISVDTVNLTYVTNSMLASALTTAGVENCIVKAAAPFEVSGTGALTGAMKAYEVATDEELDDQKKDIANEEIKTSIDLADEVGEDEATDAINDAKEEVIQKSADAKSNGADSLTEDEIKKIVEDTLTKKNLKVSDEKKQELTELLQKVSEQNYDLEKIKSNLSQISEKLDSLKKEAEKTATSEETKGFFTSLWEEIKTFFTNLFGGRTTKGSSGTTEGSSGTTEGSTVAEKGVK